MARALACFTLLLTVLPAMPSGATVQGEHAWRIEELADGVYAALQPDETRFDDSNSLILVGPHEVLLVDAQASADAVRALQERIAAITDLPVRTLVNTHWHGDHTMGNALHRERYGPELRILGHASLLEDIPGRAAALIEEQRAYFEAELGPARERLEEGVDREGRVMSRETREAAAAQIEAAEEWLEANGQARFEVPDTVVGTALATSRLGRTVQLIHAPGHTRATWWSGCRTTGSWRPAI